MDQHLSLKRCAIYTRKSTNHLLDEELNSLQAQREVCSSYIASQRHRGWVEIPDHYDDGGQSGTNIARPAMATLMGDIESGKVDVVVIYKIDRLTRSLLDFVRMVEVFDRYGIAFVSISQSFDTSDSVGRMIVNILLTFSQFERELISDRVRDNIRMRKRHGKWSGGVPPLGYISSGAGLIVVEEEASIVRFVFSEFLKGGSYSAAKKAVLGARLHSSPKVIRSGKAWGGKPISSGHVYAMLNNPIYVGEIRGHEGNYVGTHKPIITQATWEAAQALSRSRAKPPPQRKATDHFLPGILWDSLGRQMHLSIERDRGRNYHYYTSSNAQWSQREYRKQFRAHAERLDSLVLAAVGTFLCDREKLRAALKSLGVYDAELGKLTTKGAVAADLLSTTPASDLHDLFAALVDTVELGKECLSITFRSVELRRFLLWTGSTKFRGQPAEAALSKARYVLDVAVHAVSAERSPVLHIPARDASTLHSIDKQLVKLFGKARKAQAMVEARRDQPIEQIAKEFRCRPGHFSRLIRLNYLAPDIVTSILDGAQPESLTSHKLLHVDLPLDWTLQRNLLGFAPAHRVLKDDGRVPFAVSAPT